MDKDIISRELELVGGQTPTMATPEEEVDWGEQLHYYYYRAKILLKRFWWLLLLTTTTGALALGYMEMQKTPTYSSNARMRVNNIVRLSTTAPSILYTDTVFQDQILYLQSPQVRNMAHERTTVMNPDRGRFPVQISVQQQPGTSILNLHATGPDPQYTRNYLNELMWAYREFSQGYSEETKKRTLTDVDNDLEKLQETIDGLDQQRIAFENQHESVTSGNLNNKAADRLQDLELQKVGLTAELRKLELIDAERFLENPNLVLNEEDSQESRLAEGQLERTATYQQVKSELAKLQAELEFFSLYLKDRHPKISRLKDAVSRKQNELAIYAKQGLQRYEAERQLRMAELEALQSEYEDTKALVAAQNQVLNDYRIILSRLERARTQYEKLRQDREDLARSDQSARPIFIEMDPPSDPVITPLQVKQKMFLGGFGGFAAGAMLVVGLGFLDNRMLTVEDLKKRFTQPVLGIIPMEQCKENGRVALLKPKDDRHMFAEACRTLRSSILFMRPNGRKAKRIVITSAVPEEGKSTISANLAVSLAMASNRTLLIDADLRRGRLDKIFSDEEGRLKGLTEVLQGDLSIDDGIFKTHVDNLDLLPCGHYPERPSELFLSPEFKDVLDEMKQRYDYVIIDSAPILATEDTCSFVKTTDAILFAVRSHYTQMRQVRASLDRLQMRGANIAGFVLNFVDLKGADYYYYNKYNKYYTYAPQAGAEAQPTN